MLFAVRFVDHVGRLAVREAHLQSHIDWLDQKRKEILVAGSLRPERGAPAVGGLWIVEAIDHAAVSALVQTDPFWRHGLRAQIEILEWSKAFPDRHVLV